MPPSELPPYLPAQNSPIDAPLSPVPVAEPEYLRQTYDWAYLNPDHVGFLDRYAVVQAILWGNAGRLMRAALQEVTPGQSILQAAAVYGPFSRLLAEKVGPSGRLDVIDIAAIQVALTQDKLNDFPQASVRQADAACPGGGAYDGVSCFFLLHETPAEKRKDIVTGLLGAVKPGGKVVFVDYHRPPVWHPLRPVMIGVFRWLEPFAEQFWKEDIASLSPLSPSFTWRKETLFGGLYQKVVAERRL